LDDFFFVFDRLLWVLTIVDQLPAIPTRVMHVAAV
jgi:hypothetical protein